MGDEGELEEATQEEVDEVIEEAEDDEEMLIGS